MAAAINSDNIDFEYPKLAAGSRQIRLISLHEIEPETPLRFMLKSIPLDAKPDFIALSYVWGTSKATETIYVNGSIFYIRPTLCEFLTTIAAKKLMGKPIFADAICINQTDFAEREAQVGLMRDIFTNASEVIAWLGPDPLLSEAVSYELFKSMQWAINGVSKAASRGPERLHYTPPRLEEIFSNLNNDWSSAEQAAILASYERPFWERLWVVQEVILAKTLTMQMGEITYDLGIYIDLYRGLVGGLTTPGSSPSSVARILPDVTAKAVWQVYDVALQRRLWHESVNEGPPLKLHEAVTRFYSQKSTEPRDKVFGLLGLAESNIIPDYRISINQLFVYVLVEGVFELHRGASVESGLLHLSVTEVLMSANFYQACMSTFQISAPQTTLMAVANRALHECGMRASYRVLILFYGWVYHEARLLFQRSYVPRIGSQVLGYCFILWHLLVGVIMFGSQYVKIYFMRRFDLDMTALDGETRSYHDWMQVVDQTADLAIRGTRPRRMSQRHESSAISQSERVINALLLQYLA